MHLLLVFILYGFFFRSVFGTVTLMRVRHSSSRNELATCLSLKVYMHDAQNIWPTSSKRSETNLDRISYTVNCLKHDLIFLLHFILYTFVFTKLITCSNNKRLSYVIIWIILCVKVSFISVAWLLICINIFLCLHFCKHQQIHLKFIRTIFTHGMIQKNQMINISIFKVLSWMSGIANIQGWNLNFNTIKFKIVQMKFLFMKNFPLQMEDGFRFI